MHDHHASELLDGQAIDPVCGMTVEIDQATARELHVEHGGAHFFFCGKGCKLDFVDAPDTYLDPSYVPSM